MARGEIGLVSPLFQPKLEPALAGTAWSVSLRIGRFRLVVVGVRCCRHLHRTRLQEREDLTKGWSRRYGDTRRRKV